MSSHFSMTRALREVSSTVHDAGHGCLDIGTSLMLSGWFSTRLPTTPRLATGEGPQPQIQPLNFRMLSHWGAHTCDKFPEGTMNGTTTHDKHHRGTCLAALVTLVGEVELPMIMMFCCQASTVAALVWQLWWSVVLSHHSRSNDSGC